MTDCAEIRIVRKTRLKIVTGDRIDGHTIVRKRRLKIVRKTDLLEDASHYIGSVDADGPNPLALNLCPDCSGSRRFVLPKAFQFEGVCRICGCERL